MQNKLFPVLFLIAGTLFSCEKIQDLTEFTIRNESNITIPGQNTGLGDLLSIPKAEVQSSSEQSFQNNNTRADLVEQAILKELELNITSPANADFDFLNDISIFISADGLKEVMVASKENIAEDGSRTIELETSGVDLKPYIIKDQFSIRTEATTDKVEDNDIDIQIKMAFAVRAKIL